jgi:hypothetical protein
MVSAPCLGIFMKNTVGNLPDSRLPGCTITFVKADNQVRRFVFIGPAINPLRIINLLNHRLVGPGRVG